MKFNFFIGHFYLFSNISCIYIYIFLILYTNDNLRYFSIMKADFKVLLKTRAVAPFFPDARTFHNIYKLQKHDSLRHQSYLIVFMGSKNLRFWLSCIYIYIFVILYTNDNLRYFSIMKADFKVLVL
jgi:hypothetical protein